MPFVLPAIAAHADEVVLIDGQSTDSTTSIAARLLSEVRIVPQRGRGKGDAIRQGLSIATGSKVVIVDADYSHDPEEIPKIVQMLDGGADVVHGSRFIKGGGSADNTVIRSAGNRILTWTMNFLCGTRYTDVTYGLFGFRRAAVDKLDLHASEWDIEVEILCQARRRGLNLVEIPSFERKRLHGGSHFNGFLVGVRNVMMMLRRTPRRRFSGND